MLTKITCNTFLGSESAIPESYAEADRQKKGGKGAICAMTIGFEEKQASQNTENITFNIIHHSTPYVYIHFFSTLSDSSLPFASCVFRCFF